MAAISYNKCLVLNLGDSLWIFFFHNIEFKSVNISFSFHVDRCKAQAWGVGVSIKANLSKLAPLISWRDNIIAKKELLLCYKRRLVWMLKYLSHRAGILQYLSAESFFVKMRYLTEEVNVIIVSGALRRFYSLLSSVIA